MCIVGWRNVLLFSRAIQYEYEEDQNYDHETRNRDKCLIIVIIIINIDDSNHDKRDNKRQTNESNLHDRIHPNVSHMMTVSMCALIEGWRCCRRREQRREVRDESWESRRQSIGRG